MQLSTMYGLNILPIGYVWTWAEAQGMNDFVERLPQKPHCEKVKDYRNHGGKGGNCKRAHCEDYYTADPGKNRGHTNRKRSKEKAMRLQERLMREYQEWRITNYDQVMAAIQGQVVEEQRRADYLDYEIRALQDQKRKLMCSFPMVCSTALLFHSETG